jgi:uncharacterized membrane protein YgdD (TMEM256/DUF423 family)
MPDLETRRRDLWGALGAASGAIAVIAGALAAHFVRDAHATELLATGARWQAVSALAAIAGAMLGARIASALQGIGGLLFAGSIYALAAGAPALAGVVTPVGGLAMIAGWIGLAVAFLRQR